MGRGTALVWTHVDIDEVLDSLDDVAAIAFANQATAEWIRSDEDQLRASLGRDALDALRREFSPKWSSLDECQEAYSQAMAEQRAYEARRANGANPKA